MTHHRKHHSPVSHKRHSHSNGNTRYTDTVSSNGRSTHSVSTKMGNNRLTQTHKSDGTQYTTQTIRRDDGSYESTRLTSNSSKPRHQSSNEPIRTYSWERDSDNERRAPPPNTELLGYIFIGVVVFCILVAIIS